MEQKWQIPTNDDHIIYGILNSAKSKTNRALVIVHGLTGHPNEYALKNAADYFSAKGYDVYRFSLYNTEEDARNLKDCTLRIHADDLNTVLKAKCANYANVFCAGHSYGGATVMIAQPENVTAVSLWDPSFDLKNVWDDIEVINSLNFVSWGVHSLINEGMIKEANNYDENTCLKLAEDFAKPIQVIHAGDGGYVKNKYSYHSKGNSANCHEVIEGTEHCFYEGNTCQQLLDKTHKFFEKF